MRQKVTGVDWCHNPTKKRNCQRKKLDSRGWTTRSKIIIFCEVNFHVERNTMQRQETTQLAMLASISDSKNVFVLLNNMYQDED